MFKNKKMLAVIAAVCIILVVVGVLLVNGGKYQATQLEGYSLMIPQSWEVSEESGCLIFKDKDTEIGQFRLLYTDHEVVDIPKALGYTPEKPQVRESDKYVTKVYEIRFLQGEDEICQYVFDDLPDFPPYQAVLTLKNVNTRTAERILQRISMPKLGANPPEKPVKELTDEFLEQAVYTVQRGTSVYAYRLSRLDRLIQAGAEQPADKASGLHILSCEAGEESRTVKTWYYVFVGGGEKKLYIYEQGEDGFYFYRNNPKLIREITRETSVEENYTRYYADGELILEAPYNSYAENKEALLAYKDTLIGDNSNVSALVQKAMPVHATLEGISLETENEPYGLSLRYVLDKPEMYITEGTLNENAFYQNALVLFSLVSNVDWIQMDIRTGETVFNVKYEREVAEKQFDEQDLSQFATDMKAFEEFTEDVPKMSPPTENNSGNGVDGTRVVTSTTVMVSSTSVVRHPKTGKMVSVKPYAERYGVTQYLDKPITVTLYEKSDAGKITMWATGSCGGVQIGSYPISSRAEFDSLLGMVG
ncbi:MAG: DUF4825 domain-containing protein [Clostridia bacterium]|nr:DUF4825 domain-containing protein [Clostridia bacterium]